MFQMFMTNENGTLEKINEFKDGCWINLYSPDKEEIKKVASMAKVEWDFLTAALDEEERSRIETEDDNTLVLIDIPVSDKDDVNAQSCMYTTIPLGIVVTPNCVITVCISKSRLVEDFINNKVKTFSTFKKNRFILQLMYRNAAYYLQYLRHIDKMSDSIEHEVHKSMKNKELISLLALRKSLVYFSTSLRSNERVFEKLLRYKFANISIKKYPDDEDLLEDVIVENKQAIEMADIYSNILSGTMDAFASIISNNLNIVMKLLATITIVMAIPNIISGFFGMNVGVPLANVTGAFYIICGATAVVCIIAAIILYKRKMF